jgi:hypothetical protein
VAARARKRRKQLRTAWRETAAALPRRRTHALAVEVGNGGQRRVRRAVEAEDARRARAAVRVQRAQSGQTGAALAKSLRQRLAKRLGDRLGGAHGKLRRL